jgi:hypothetical protein
VTPRKTITSLASERREFMSLPGSGSLRGVRSRTLRAHPSPDRL